MNSMRRSCGVVQESQQLKNRLSVERQQALHWRGWPAAPFVERGWVRLATDALSNSLTIAFSL